MKKILIISILLIATYTYAAYQPIPQVSHFGTKKSSVVDLSANDIQMEILEKLTLIEEHLSIITGENLQGD